MGMGRVHLSLYNLIVEVEQETAYPDQMLDLTNRAYETFANAIAFCKEAQLDIRSEDVEDFLEDDE